MTKPRTSAGLELIPHKSIDRVVNIGYGGDISTRIRGVLTHSDGTVEELFDREGHSYTRNFIDILYYHAAQTYVAYDSVSVDDVSIEHLAIINNSASYGTGFVISAATAASPCRITITGHSGTTLDGYPVRFSGLTYSSGTPSSMNNQTLYLNYISNGVFDVYTNSALTTPFDRSIEGAYDASSGRIWPCSQQIAAVGAGDKDTILHADNDNFSTGSLYLGTNTKAVNIQDTDLEQWDGAMYDGRQSQIRDVPVVSPTRSYIRFTRDFQNTSGASVTVEELGLFCNNSDNTTTPALLLARDLQTIVVPDSSTLTLYFEIETTIDILSGNNEGGITQWFNEMLYRFIAQTSRSVTDRNNANHTESNTSAGFGMVGGAYSEPYGGTRLRPYTGSSGAGRFNHYVGPVVGRDDSTAIAIAQDNYTLGDLVEPGDGIGELWYGGSYVHGLAIRGGGWGSVELTGGGSGSVDDITVNGVSIMSSSVSFNTSLSQTALDVVSNINAYTSSPNYTASAVGRVITIKAAEDVGAGADGYAVVSSTTTITSSDTNIADGNTAEFKVTRLFENRSGESIQIQEVGLFANIDGDYEQQALMSRHIHDGVSGRPSPTTVDNAEVLRVTYTFRATV